MFVNKQIVLLLFSLLSAGLFYHFNAPPVSGLGKSVPANRIVRLQPDTVSLIRNPLNGWVIYATAGSGQDIWTKFDSLSVPGIKRKVKVSDYASVLYIRMGWSQFEPQEGEYAWKKPGMLRLLIDGARERGLKLAFRINVDSRDKAVQSTPDYVRAAGAQGYTSRSGRKVLWSPYPDDAIFQDKYQRFLNAFAADFNDPDQVGFIDGYGLGKWGESHSVVYLDERHREQVFNWLTNLYVKYFTNVPLLINYHRLIGTHLEWGKPDSNSKALLESAIKKGYALRHDAFGMTGYYQKFEKDLAAKWFPERPVIVEGGWLHNGDGYLKDPRGFKNWGEVWQGEYDDAAEARANMMDLRDVKETTSWFETAFPLVKKFIKEGGYRLYPDSISLATQIKPGATVTIAHRWRNLGMGVCPVNLPQYHNSYKVAFTLLQGNKPVAGAIWIDVASNPANWLFNKPATYQLKLKPRRLKPGRYQWAVAIVDTQSGNKPAINLAVTGAAPGAWLALGDVVIKSN